MSTYLVSGVTSGIGHAVCQQLLSQGHQVIALVRKEPQILPINMRFLTMDFSNPEFVEQSLSRHQWPSIKAFINCAGATRSKSIREIQLHDIQYVYNTNILSPMLVINSIIPHLENDSSIVLLGSQSAYKGSYDDAYASSKGAVDSLVKSIAAKLAPKTRVINFAPGLTYPTRLTEIMPEELRQKKMQEVPMKRFASPQEMAEVIIFLTSPACRFMTGNTVDMNGGLVLR